MFSLSVLLTACVLLCTCVCRFLSNPVAHETLILGFWASVTQYLRVLSVCVASARGYNDVMVASYDMYLQTFGIDNCNQAVSVLYQLPL